jgi:hypothetical protein
MKYRTIKTPPVESKIALGEVKKLASCLKSGKVSIRVYRLNKADLKTSKNKSLKECTLVTNGKSVTRWKPVNKGKIRANL